MHWEVEVLVGSRRGERFPLSVFPFSVGRAAECNLRPKSESISRFHCRIWNEKDRLLIQDCSTPEGTFVNDHRIDGITELHDHDQIRIGPLHFRIDEVDDLFAEAIPKSEQEFAQEISESELAFAEEISEPELDEESTETMVARLLNEIDEKGNKQLSHLG
jgi:pSer/pThr/pTyr-binding forkhead associated (FHA) protein